MKMQMLTPNMKELGCSLEFPMNMSMCSKAQNMVELVAQQLYDDESDIEIRSLQFSDIAFTYHVLLSDGREPINAYLDDNGLRIHVYTESTMPRMEVSVC